ncbi:unnamed protein product [Zymoseptoria tritici ST99CH_3D1]|uniref:Uncharacterized protein n=1 Tax=Zymoseptoria tritici ST99CH_1E4 TaxID=1276532 RepID=A0A2H1GC39_ZYMTR|nr:unnamed protein product [Zymoseptoria tritici ST99CH_1E4]SMR52064.1 unnamed protein product [Zymoseptoria tritici ST99CH_3D1]
MASPNLLSFKSPVYPADQRHYKATNSFRSVEKALEEQTNPSDFEDQIVLQELLDVLSSQFCRYHGASNPATGSVVLDAVANPDNKYNFVYIEPPPPDVSSRVREDGTVMDGEIPEPEQEVQDEHAAQGSDNDDDDWQAAAERHDSERRQQQQSEELPKTEPCQLPPTSRTLPYMSPKFLFLRPGLQYLFVLTVPLGHTFDLFDEIRAVQSERDHGSTAHLTFADPMVQSAPGKKALWPLCLPREDMYLSRNTSPFSGTDTKPPNFDTDGAIRAGLWKEFDKEHKGKHIAMLEFLCYWSLLHYSALTSLSNGERYTEAGKKYQAISTILRGMQHNLKVEVEFRQKRDGAFAQAHYALLKKRAVLNSKHHGKNLASSWTRCSSRHLNLCGGLLHSRLNHRTFDLTDVKK